MNLSLQPLPPPGSGDTRSPCPISSPTNVISQVVGEMEDIEFRKPNLVLFNLEESVSVNATERVAADKQMFENVVGAMSTASGSVVDFVIKSITRLGKRDDDKFKDKPRPLKVF